MVEKNKTSNVKTITGMEVFSGVVKDSYLTNIRGKGEYQMRIVVEIGNCTYLKNIMCAWNAGEEYIRTCGCLGLIDEEWMIHHDWLIGKTVSVTFKTYKGNLYIDEIWYPEDAAEEESDFREIKDFGEVEGFYPDIA